MTERVHGDSTRRAPTLAAARPSREHPSWVMLARIVPGHGRFTPSVVRRSGLARRRRRASRVGQRMVRCGYVPRLDIFRVLHGSCDASRSKRGHRVVGVAVFNRARVRCANAFGEFGISQLFRANTYYRMPWNTVRNLTYQDHLYFPTNSRFFTTSTYGTVLLPARFYASSSSVAPNCDTPRGTHVGRPCSASASGASSGARPEERQGKEGDLRGEPPSLPPRRVPRPLPVARC